MDKQTRNLFGSLLISLSLCSLRRCSVCKLQMGQEKIDLSNAQFETLEIYFAEGIVMAFANNIFSISCTFIIYKIAFLVYFLTCGTNEIVPEVLKQVANRSCFKSCCYSDISCTLSSLHWIIMPSNSSFSYSGVY